MPSAPPPPHPASARTSSSVPPRMARFSVLRCRLKRRKNPGRSPSNAWAHERRRRKTRRRASCPDGARRRGASPPKASKGCGSGGPSRGARPDARSAAAAAAAGRPPSASHSRVTAISDDSARRLRGRLVTFERGTAVRRLAAAPRAPGSRGRAAMVSGDDAAFTLSTIYGNLLIKTSSPSSGSGGGGGGRGEGGGGCRRDDGDRAGATGRGPTSPAP